MTSKKVLKRQILIIGTSDSQSLSQKRHKQGTVLNKNSSKNISKSFIKDLPEFVPTDFFAKKITQRLTTRQSNFDLKNNLRT